MQPARPAQPARARRASPAQSAKQKVIPFLDDVSHLFNDAEVEFGDNEVKLITRMKNLDLNSRFKMFTEPREGKKFSQYGFLVSKLNEIWAQNHGDNPYAHNYMLSCMLGRPVTKENPPGSDCKELLDKIMENDEDTLLAISELSYTISDWLLWQKEQSEND